MEAQIEIPKGQSNKTDVPDNNVGDIDCISRKFMRDLGATCIAYRNDKQELIPIISIDNLPSVTPQLSSELDKNSKKLEKDFGESDCISRTRAIERLKLNLPISQGADNSRDRHRYMQALADIQAIREMPSVTSQKRKEHWINHREYCEMNNLRPSGLGSYFWCSNCDCGIDAREWVRNNYNYCPRCGANMEGQAISGL